MPTGILGGLGAAFTIITASVLLAAGAFKKLMDMLDEARDRYAAVNPQIATAEAKAGLNTFMQDVRRGQEIAPNLVRYIETRTALENQIENKKVAFLTKVEPLISAGLGLLEIAVNAIPAQQIGELLNYAAKQYTGFLTVAALLYDMMQKSPAGTLPADQVFDTPDPFQVFKGLPDPTAPPPRI